MTRTVPPLEKTATVSGMLMTLFVVYRPSWVTTF